MLRQMLSNRYFSCGFTFAINTQRRDGICYQVGPLFLAIKDIVCGDMDKGNSDLFTGRGKGGRSVAVGCKGGLLRVYNARSGELIWNKRNIGQKRDNGLMQVDYDRMDGFYTLLDAALLAPAL